MFAEVIEAYLSRIKYGADGYATSIRVPAYEHAQVVADPTRAYGVPIFERGGVRVDDVLERLWGGDPLDELSLRLVTLAEHYGVPADESVMDEEWLELAGTSGWVDWTERERRALQRQQLWAAFVDSRDEVSPRLELGRRTHARRHMCRRRTRWPSS